MNMAELIVGVTGQDPRGFRSFKFSIRLSLSLSFSLSLARPLSLIRFKAERARRDSKHDLLQLSARLVSFPRGLAGARIQQRVTLLLGASKFARFASKCSWKVKALACIGRVCMYVTSLVYPTEKNET